MDINEMRRSNLRLWLETNPVPRNEKSYFSQLLSGKTAFGEKAARRIEQTYGMSFGFLDGLFVTDEYHRTTLPASYPANITPVANERRKDYRATVDIPVLDVVGSMGNGVTLPEYEDVVHKMTVTTAWLHRTVAATAWANLALITGYGDSMQDTFSDGDLLLVDRGVTEIKIDAIYVLALNDELYIKRLQRRPDGSILMISDNRNYEPYLIQNGEREKFRVLGRVVLAWNATKL